MILNFKNSSEEKSLLQDRILVHPHAEIINSEIEGNCHINSYSHINCSTISKFFNLGLYSYVAYTEIGKFCSFGSRLSVGASNHPINYISTNEISYKNTLEIFGETIYDTQQRSINLHNTRTIIGHDVWICDNSVILNGSKIGTGCVVGAGSVVRGSFPPYAVIVGNPAKIVKFRFSDDVIEKLINSKWWDLPFEKLKLMDFTNVNNFISMLY